MHTGLHYFPLSGAFVLLFTVLWGTVAALVFLRVIRYAYVSMGVAPQYIFAVLVLSLIGSYLNIAVAQLPDERVISREEVLFYGMRYAIPVVRDWPGTIIAVNVGGAVIPTLTSVYLALKNGLYWRSLLGVALVALICHWLAHPVPGLGIAIPVFIPPLATALVAVVLSRRYAPPLAYISGSLGTLIGADLLNLNRIRGLGSPIVSIGGAGTFDGIFVTGLVAVLLASIVTAPRDETALPA